MLEADNNCKFGVNQVNQIMNEVGHESSVKGTTLTLFIVCVFIQVVDGEIYPPAVSDVPVHMVYPEGIPPERRLAIGQELFGIVPGLTMYATLWLREHNRVCDILKAEHPTWDDEQLFQTTRLIIIGESQASAILHCWQIGFIFICFFVCLLLSLHCSTLDHLFSVQQHTA